MLHLSAFEKQYKASPPMCADSIGRLTSYSQGSGGSCCCCCWGASLTAMLTPSPVTSWTPDSGTAAAMPCWSSAAAPVTALPPSAA